MTIVLEDFALQHLLLAVGRHDKIVWVWSIAVVGEGQSMRALKHSRGTLVCGHVLKSDKARDQEIVRVVLNIGMDLFDIQCYGRGTQIQTLRKLCTFTS